MIVRSKAETRDFDEACSLCDREIPNDSFVLRNVETTYIICIFCIAELAEVTKNEVEQN